MIAIDTSVSVPALARWHRDHEQARNAARGAVAPAHVLAETYSVLTRLPSPHRFTTAVAATTIIRWFPPNRVLVPSLDLLAGLPTRLAAAGVTGGATFDGLIALTVDEAGGELLTRDVRATRTYEVLGVAYRLVGGDNDDGADSASA